MPHEGADCDFINSARLPTVSCHVIPCVWLWAAASVWSWCQALKKRQQQLQQIQDPTTVGSPGGGSWCWPCWLLQHLQIMDPSNANLADECSCFILFTSMKPITSQEECNSRNLLLGLVCTARRCSACRHRRTMCVAGGKTCSYKASHILLHVYIYIYILENLNINEYQSYILIEFVLLETCQDSCSATRGL